jgi:hypothetical protein
MWGKIAFVFFIVFYSCTFESPPDEYTKIDIIKRDKKALLFENTRSKIGDEYSGTNAHFIYDCLKEVLGESEIPSFEDKISPSGIYSKSLAHRTSILEGYFELGDVVFINRENVSNSPFGFIESYDFSLGIVSYICVISNRIILQTAQINQRRVSIRQLALKG